MANQFEFGLNDPRKPRPVLEPPTPEEQRLIDDWLSYHAANPHIGYLVVAATLDEARRRQRYGIGAVFEDLRYMKWIRRDDRIWKLNHNHRAFYARWFLYHYPEFGEFFETNHSAADKVDYSKVD
jgi:hypothetical protein